MLGKRHFVKALVNAFVAEAAYPDSLVKHFPGNVFAEMGAAMHLLWNKMVKSEFNPAMTALAGSWGVLGLAHTVSTSSGRAWLTHAGKRLAK